MRLLVGASIAALGCTAAPSAVEAEDSTDPIPLQPIQGQFCGALAPDGWTIIDEDRARGSNVTLASADQQMKAALAIPGIGGGSALYEAEY
jgi:hypothetical protein